MIKLWASLPQGQFLLGVTKKLQWYQPYLLNELIKNGGDRRKNKTRGREVMRTEEEKERGRHRENRNGDRETHRAEDKSHGALRAHHGGTGMMGM